MKPVNLYIAAKWEAGPRVRKLASAMSQIPGMTVVSTWHERPPYSPERDATTDLYDLLKASMLILDTLDESNTGGREVEWGYCLGREAVPGTALDLILVGPRRNIFHHLADFQFDAWHEAIEWLTKRQTR